MGKFSAYPDAYSFRPYMVDCLRTFNPGRLGMRGMRLYSVSARA